MSSPKANRPFGCKCETLRERVLGDGCDECNKALVIEMLEVQLDELRADLKRAIELAEMFVLEHGAFPHVIAELESLKTGH